MVGPLCLSVVTNGIVVGWLTCDFVRRASLASRDENKKLHYAIVDLAAPRLNNKDVLISNAGKNLDTGLALGIVSIIFSLALWGDRIVYICKLRELNSCWIHA